MADIEKPPARKTRIISPAAGKFRSDVTADSATDPLVDFNFKVPAAFRTRFRAQCLARGVKGVDIMREAMEEYWAKYPANLDFS